MIMVVQSGRNPTMRHSGRTHGRDIQGLHDRLGPNPGRDNVTLFYENTHNMSADIYTKSFKDLPSWKHALKLINIFEPEDLLPQNLMEWCDKRHELANIPSENVEERAGWSKKGKRKGKNLEDAKKAKEDPDSSGSESASSSSTNSKPNKKTKKANATSSMQSKHMKPVAIAVPGVGGFDYEYSDELYDSLSLMANQCSLQSADTIVNNQCVRHIRGDRVRVCHNRTVGWFASVTTAIVKLMLLICASSLLIGCSHVHSPQALAIPSLTTHSAILALSCWEMSGSANNVSEGSGSPRMSMSGAPVTKGTLASTLGHTGTVAALAKPPPVEKSRVIPLPDAGVTPKQMRDIDIEAAKSSESSDYDPVRIDAVLLPKASPFSSRSAEMGPPAKQQRTLETVREHAHPKSLQLQPKVPQIARSRAQQQTQRIRE